MEISKSISKLFMDKSRTWHVISANTNVAENLIYSSILGLCMTKLKAFIAHIVNMKVAKNNISRCR